jgi:putative Ca2+/H+ antiporter (TMEM165/GDT1 family)
MFDWRLIVSSFTMIFFAELGDKTQISIFALATNRGSFLSIFTGAVSALILTTLLAVVLGGAVGRFVPEKVMKIFAGSVFLLFGAFTIYGALRG